MIKKSVICAAAFAFVFSLTVAGGVSLAADAGPVEMTLKTAKGKKPATFPHKKHQDMLKCGDCHHTKTADGKKGPYVAGKEGKCESCHDGKSIANKKVANYMKAAHENCKGCHKAQKKGPTKCAGCHPKK